MKARKVLVTGSRGQIGSALVKSLRQADFDVFELDCLPGRADHYFQCDLVKDDLEHLRNIGIDYAIHLAGDKSDPPGSEPAIIRAMKSNVRGTIRLLESVRSSAKHVIYASSISVYGDTRVPYREDQLLMPRTLYGASKAAAEAYLAYYRRSTAICILRIAQVVGPRTPEHIAPVKMINSARNGKVIISCTEKTTRDYVHVADVVMAIVSAIQRKASGIFNIGSGKATSLVGLAEYITGITGSLLENAPSSELEREIWMSIDKARLSLDYEPKWTIEKWVSLELQEHARQDIR